MSNVAIVVLAAANPPAYLGAVALEALRRANRDQIHGKGRFSDLQQVLRFEVAR